VAVCHAVNGKGNTGNGYNYIEVSPAAAEQHKQHRGDLVPAPNRDCLVPEAAIMASMSLPSSTTTTAPTVTAEAEAPVSATSTTELDTTASVPEATAALAATGTETQPGVTTGPPRTGSPAPADPTTTEIAVETSTTAPMVSEADTTASSAPTEPPVTTAATEPPIAEPHSGWGRRRLWLGALTD
jgi:hypothetical protein